MGISFVKIMNPPVGEPVGEMEPLGVSPPYIAREVPEGKPQIVWNAHSKQWDARGDVLRCLIEEGEDAEGSAAIIVIDGQELTMCEFGQLLRIYTGWGMRLVMVPNDELTIPPTIQIGEIDGGCG